MWTTFCLCFIKRQIKMYVLTQSRFKIQVPSWKLTTLLLYRPYINATHDDSNFYNKPLRIIDKINSPNVKPHKTKELNNDEPQCFFIFKKYKISFDANINISTHKVQFQAQNKT